MKCRKVQDDVETRGNSLTWDESGGWPESADNTGDALDYFGAIVNIAARLEHQCRGGEVIVSEAVAKDAETEAALTDRMQLEETATLRGVGAPVQLVRVKGLRSARLPVV